MPTFNSIQMTAPTFPVSGPGMGGRVVHLARGEFNLSAALSVADILRMMRLHPRFRVIGGFVKTTGLGTGVTVTVGDAAVTNRYFASAAAAVAGTNIALADTGRDYLVPAFSDVLITLAGATTATTGQIVVVLTGTIEEPA